MNTNNCTRYTRWFLYLYLALVLTQGVAYFTHPARDINAGKAHDKWVVIASEIITKKSP